MHWRGFSLFPQRVENFPKPVSRFEPLNRTSNLLLQVQQTVARESVTSHRTPAALQNTQRTWLEQQGAFGACWVFHEPNCRIRGID